MSMRATSFIMLEGQAAEAIDFYRNALKAELLYRTTYEEGKDADRLPDEAKSRIAHAVLQTGETELMVADRFPGQPHEMGDVVSICLTVTERHEIEQMFQKLSERGQTLFPLQETEFSPCYGLVKDRFNVTFHLFLNETTQGWS